jgi:hypothetical protein
LKATKAMDSVGGFLVGQCKFYVQLSHLRILMCTCSCYSSGYNNEHQPYASHTPSTWAFFLYATARNHQFGRRLHV